MIIGLFLKHIKAYKGIRYVPVGSKYNFVSYIGENGAGKSSILEALDSFFNNKPYLINKSALSDGIKTQGNEPFISPIFLIKKDKVTRQKKEFDKVSSFFWNINKKDIHASIQTSMGEFFKVRELLIDEGYNENEYYLMIVGEINLNNGQYICFGTFLSDESFVAHMLEEGKISEQFEQSERRKIVLERREYLSSQLLKGDWKKFLQAVKDFYSYVYFPVELDIESFTKIETNEMQKIFDRKIKNEIEKALESVNFTKSGGINKTLDKFVTEIENILNNEYCYRTGQDRNNSVTKSDLTNKILEVYFQKRVLNKIDDNGNTTKVSELSAGEKRQSLINLVYAFLKRNNERDKMVIIGIDEPENSLHTTLCYDQFEKLKEISSNNQILVTTHWYGFLPVVSEGYGHFLKSENKKINFDSYDLYDYRAKISKDVADSKNTMPSNFILKSTYDLVQSIFYSLLGNNPYNWIICEGVSEKIYFEHFFKDKIKELNLRILPMGGQNKVIRLYDYLITPMTEQVTQGKVFCLIDTDQIRCKEINDNNKNICIKRLSNLGDNKETKLLTLQHSDTYSTDIENSLNPKIFEITMNLLASEDKYKITEIVNEKGNSDFLKNFKNFDIEHFFKNDNGINKIKFAEKYVDVNGNYQEDHDDADVIPNWIREIDNFFK
ncbi:AAA family ATPase [Photobacterium leiognathi]|uniref:AAA family ATPase n=1 Tax=Photobacterium leiognathi TaxID=553611 RepID=UPI0029813E27|nr:AAA family ATPase [Photobacterium leiognathi]